MKIIKTYCKRLHSNCSDEVFVIKNVKITLPCTYAINDNCWNILQKRIVKKKNQKEFRVEKVIERKCDKLWYVKWKGYDNFFNC